MDPSPASMEDEPIYSKIRDLTRTIVESQDLLSDPQKRSEYKEYVTKDEELFGKIGECDYQSFSLLCEFGSVKALINEKRYNRIHKQSQSSLLRSILGNWRCKYMSKVSGSPEEPVSSAESEHILDGSGELAKLNWSGWFHDHSQVNIFPINNIKFNTLQGLLGEGDGTEPPAKKVRVVNSKSKSSHVRETQMLENENIHDIRNTLVLQEFKSRLLSRIQEEDVGHEGIELWDLVLDKNRESGFTNTCFNLFSLLSLLKDSLVSITSPDTVIEGNTDADQRVLVFAGSSKISSDSEKNTGIISNFTHKVWQDLCTRRGQTKGQTVSA